MSAWETLRACTFAGLFFIGSGVATRAEPGDRNLADDFATCTAVFSSVSDFARRDDKALGEYFAGLAAEASVAGAMVLSREIPWEAAMAQVRNAAAARVLVMRNRIASGGPNGPIRLNMARCRELNALQKDLAAEARRQFRLGSD